MAAMAAARAVVADSAHAPAPAKPRPVSSATRWMTRFRSSFAGLFISLLTAGCATSSGAPATTIAQPDIASAYLPLHGHIHLGIDAADGAAVVIAPHVAVTNAHNANLLNPKNVIGVRQDYDLLFFRTARVAEPPTAQV